MEKVFGPVSGYYIATFACPMGELGDEYLPFARVWRHRPRSYWDGAAIVEICGDERVRTESVAHHRALRLALAELKSTCVPAERLTAQSAAS